MKKKINSLVECEYDEDADVLYMTFGKPVPCICTEDEAGVVIRHTYKPRKLNGITIVDFKKRTSKGGKSGR
ncbi:MAG: DUF2283 domain-containing protein [Alphaproteobacteria bacterium]|nr:MAG: DUF2283 domain-containing protein [Alphaproteobacteria bacterium]RPJ75211.1 MAG: DUF2283 domain-containing protein [Alphaproteobacteria bacterium]